MKRKLMAMLLTLALAFSLAACAVSVNTNNATTQPSVTGNATAQTTTDNTVNAADNSVVGNSATSADNTSDSATDQTSADSSDWPSNWPSDIPKIAGTIQNEGGDVNDSGGLSVMVVVTDVSVFNDWVKAVTDKGFTQVYDTDTGNGGRSVCYSNDKYTIMGSFLASGNLAGIAVTAN